MRIVVISGPSGIGKSTIAKRLLANAAVRLEKTISATTRASRSSEVDGKDYYFLTTDEFASKRLSGAFIESNEVHAGGVWYGTLASEIARIEKNGACALLEIDINGGLEIAELYPEAVTIFIDADDANVYESRLRERATESEEQIQMRLRSARRELAMADRYRFRVYNRSIDQVVEEIIQILIGQWKNKELEQCTKS